MDRQRILKRRLSPSICMIIEKFMHGTILKRSSSENRTNKNKFKKSFLMVNVLLLNILYV